MSLKLGEAASNINFYKSTTFMYSNISYDDMYFKSNRERHAQFANKHLRSLHNLRLTNFIFAPSLTSASNPASRTDRAASYFRHGPVIPCVRSILASGPNHQTAHTLVSCIVCFHLECFFIVVADKLVAPSRNLDSRFFIKLWLDIMSLDQLVDFIVPKNTIGFGAFSPGTHSFVWAAWFKAGWVGSREAVTEKG